jgi:hypothetical protein
MLLGLQASTAMCIYLVSSGIDGHLGFFPSFSFCAIMGNFFHLFFETGLCYILGWLQTHNRPALAFQ